MKTLRVLVVDDEPGMRLGVARALRGFTVRPTDVDLTEEYGFAVDQAADGEEALGKIRAAPPDILLLDHKMPGMSGLELLDRLREEPPGGDGDTDAPADTLTIMITAYASLETAISATKRGAYDFLAKPFTPEELRASSRKAANHLIVQREARKLARERHQVRFEFISVLAHELKAPIAAVEGYLNLMRERTAGEDLAAYDHAIQRSCVRLEGMRKMILDLLDLTRIESGRKSRELSDVDVVEVARTAIETFAPAAGERGIEIELHTDGPVALTGDRGEIEIILNNLVSNAVKYNRDGGRVDVTVSRGEPGGAVLSVADTGIGMSQEEAGRLFEEFVRIKNARTRNIMGSGLGLSIVRKLARLYGGDVVVQSEPDVGTTFTVTIPPVPDPERPDRREPGARAAGEGAAADIRPADA